MDFAVLEIGGDGAPLEPLEPNDIPFLLVDIALIFNLGVDDLGFAVPQVQTAGRQQAGGVRQR